MPGFRRYVSGLTAFVMLAMAAAPGAADPAPTDTLLSSACARVARQLAIRTPLRIERITLQNYNPNRPGFSARAPDSLAAVLSAMRFEPKPLCACGHTEVLTMAGPDTTLAFDVCDHCLGRYRMTPDLWRLLRAYARDPVAGDDR